LGGHDEEGNKITMIKDKPVDGIAEEFLIPEVLDKGLSRYRSQFEPICPDYEAIARIKG